MLTLRARLGLLERAVPGGEVAGIDDQGGPDRARLLFRGTRTVKFAYLDSVEGDGLPLRLYAGDTLEQAKALFESEARVQHMLALRGRGWVVEPHFHWGFTQRGFCWTRSSLSADEYARYWVDRIDRTGAIKRDEWEPELERLIADGLYSSSDRACFRAHFTDTKRQSAVPRPTLAMTRVWLLAEAESGNFAATLRAGLIEALTALGESADSLRQP